MSDVSHLSDGQLDAAYDASFNAGDHTAMNYYAQEILTRLGTGAGFIGALWDKVTGSAPRFPLYTSHIGQVPPTPGLLPQNTPAAPGFDAGAVAVESVQASAANVWGDLKIGGFAVGSIALLLLVLIIFLRFGKR